MSLRKLLMLPTPLAAATLDGERVTLEAGEVHLG